MDVFADFQGLLILGLATAAVVLKVYALIDALRVNADAFPAAGKLTKPLWLTFLGVALATEVAFFPLRVIFLSIIGVVAAAVYVVDVRPAVRAMGGGRRGRDRNEGPYGPW